MARSPLVATDVVIFTIDEGCLKVLLVKVTSGRHAGEWAFPGGLVSLGHSPEATAARELLAQTGLKDVYLEQLRTFGEPDRDPDKHVVSVAFFALVPHKGVANAASGKYSGIGWFPLQELPPLAYDHDKIAAYALERLRAKLEYTNIAYSLLPEELTLGELQEIYEIILGRQLDRRNFCKKILTLRLLRPLRKVRRGPHRPARLYSFRQRQPMVVEIL